MSTIVTILKKNSPSYQDSNLAGMNGEHVLEVIHQLMHIYRSEQYQSRHVDQLTHLEGKVLRYFANHPGSTLKELGESFLRDKGQLAKLINSLKQRGYLSARSDELDKRQIRLELTKEGSQVQKQLRLRTQQLAQKACQGLSYKKREELIESIEIMIDNLKAHEH